MEGEEFPLQKLLKACQAGGPALCVGLKGIKPTLQASLLQCLPC